MNREDLRIVFMGTPDIAVESLRCLHEGGYRVVGVITTPDKPAGRGHRLRCSPVKEYALAHDLPLLQPERLKDEAFVRALRAWQADLQVVVAFRMLPEVVWAMPRLGTFNLHASLLPQYRGAAPINWAVINGDTETGLTTFFLQHEIDTGEVISQVRVPIHPEDNAGTLHDRLMTLGGQLVVETVDRIISGHITSIPQSELTATGPLRPAPKIFKETCRIDWRQSARQVHNLVRGLSPYPAAWTELELTDGQRVTVKVYETAVVAPAAETLEQSGDHDGMPAPGTVLTNGRTYLHVATADGWVSLLQLQLPGKKVLRVGELLRGLRLPANDF